MKKIITLLALLLVAVALVTACNNDSGNNVAADPGTVTDGGDTAAAARDTLVVGLTANPVSLNPFATTDNPASRVNYNIHQRLVARDTDMNVIPSLAERWEIVDDTTYIFHIRQGVLFHNGETLTAHDVAFSFAQLDGNPHAAAVTGPIDFANSRAIDDYTFELRMLNPFAPILQHLAHPVTSIVNEKAFLEAGEDYSRQPIGTGPFQFVEWRPDEFVRLERFDDYWGNVARLRELTFRIIPESATRTIELETGGIDLAIGVSPSDVPRLRGLDHVVINSQETFTTNFIGLVNHSAPFDNVLVRQALNYAIDRNAILNIAFAGNGTIAQAPMSPTVWGFNENLPPLEFNPERARELLAQAGFPDGFHTTITTDELQLRRDVAEIVQAQLAQIGVTVDIITLERGAYIGGVIAGEFDMFVLGWSTFGDPDYALYASFHSTTHGASGNMSFYSNPALDVLLEQGRVSVDDAERLAAYAAAQAIIWEEVPVLFIQHDVENTGFTADLKGFAVTPDGYFSFNEMYF